MNEISEQSLGGRSGTTSGRFPTYLISPLLSSPYCPCFNSQLSSLPGIAGVLFIDYFHPPNRGTPDGSEGKESSCNARDTGDSGLIPGLGRSPVEEKMATHASILPWEIPWTEKPGGLVHRVAK